MFIIAKIKIKTIRTIIKVDEAAVGSNITIISNIITKTLISINRTRKHINNSTLRNGTSIKIIMTITIIILILIINDTNHNKWQATEQMTIISNYKITKVKNETAKITLRAKIKITKTLPLDK